MRTSILDATLLWVTSVDAFRLVDAVQNVFVMGQVGSGKTSGSGKALRTAFLRSGMGGIVLCAKPDEAPMWRKACAEHGRTASLIEWDGTNHGFNFIAAELSRHGVAGLNTVVELILRILEMARIASASTARPGEAFWEDTSRQILRNSLAALFAATGTVRITDLLQFVRSAPQSPEQMTDREWQRTSFFFAAFMAAAGKLDDASGERATAYWRDDWGRLDPKTRGNILISLTTALDRFNHGWLADAFCGATTLVPELTFHGAIILLNMPTLVRNEDGIIAQQLFKFCWQRAALARNSLAEPQQRRPIFCWADEAHIFTNSADADFLSASRSSLVCNVFLSQSLPTYYAKLGGGEGGHDRVHHLISNFATLIWHSNSCATTNEWAAKTIGRTMQRRASFNLGQGTNASYGMGLGEGTSWSTNSSFGTSHTSGPHGGQTNNSQSRGGSWGGNDSANRNRGSGSSENRSWGYSEQMDHLIEPAAFGQMLKTGGRTHRGRVSAVWYQSSRRFEASGSNSVLAEFQQ